MLLTSSLRQLEFFSFEYIPSAGRRWPADERIEALLTAWGTVCDAFSHAVEGDMAFAYDARASVSTLAMAAHAIGLQALEGSKADDTDRDGRRMGAHRRGDLWAYDPESRRSLAFAATQLFAADGCPEPIIGTALQAAVDQARHGLDANAAYGVTFITPKIDRRATGRRDIVNRFNQLLIKVRAFKPAHLCYLLAQRPEETLSYDRRKIDYYWPGVILAISQAG